MGQFRIRFTDAATEALVNLGKDRSAERRLRAVQKTLGLMETNLRHPSLRTHKYSRLSGPNGEEVFEAYVENKTPAAFRIFWCYGPGQGELTIVGITAHP